MAEAGRTSEKNSRRTGTRRSVRRGDSYREETVYINGNNALALSQPQRRPSVSEHTRANREKALQMNLTYVAFLAAAAVACVTVCVRYLRIQSNYTALQKKNTSLTATLDDMKHENDAEYNRIMSSVNLEEVRDVAMNKLGMVYASSDQIITYDETGSDYAAQYQNIP